MKIISIHCVTQNVTTPAPALAETIDWTELAASSLPSVSSTFSSTRPEVRGKNIRIRVGSAGESASSDGAQSSVCENVILLVRAIEEARIQSKELVNGINGKLPRENLQSAIESCLNRIVRIDEYI
jgi:hypothetical protein